MAKHLSISDFMSSQVTSIDIDVKLLPITKLMQEQNISCVMVLNGSTPVGIITEKSIVHFMALHPDADVATVTAKALISPSLVTLNQNDSLFEAMVLCRSQKVKHLAVVDDTSQLAGLITYSDLVDANFAQIEQQAALLGDKHNGDNSINARLLEMSLTDSLMNIGNRRSMEIDLKQTHDLSTRYNRPYSIALIDVDFFKKFNDFYGHMAGDEALKSTATQLKNNIRSVDRLYRYGGEELLLLMPETNGKDSLDAANRLIQAITDLNLTHEISPFGKLSISIGVSMFNPNENSTHSWPNQIETADKALYESKTGGRCQARFFDGLGNTNKTALG